MLITKEQGHLCNHRKEIIGNWGQNVSLCWYTLTQKKSQLKKLTDPQSVPLIWDLKKKTSNKIFNSSKNKLDKSEVFPQSLKPIKYLTSSAANWPFLALHRINEHVCCRSTHALVS